MDTNTAILLSILIPSLATGTMGNQGVPGFKILMGLRFLEEPQCASGRA